MNDPTKTKLEPPRFETGKAMLIAGLSEPYVCEDKAGIPSQWQRFCPHIRKLPAQVGKVARLRLAPQKYAVFQHHDQSPPSHPRWHDLAHAQ